jgi:hypothetical protein
MQVIFQIANPFNCAHVVCTATRGFASSPFGAYLCDGTSSISGGAFQVRADSLSVMFDVLSLKDAVGPLLEAREERTK